MTPVIPFAIPLWAELARRGVAALVARRNASNA